MVVVIAGDDRDRKTPREVLAVNPTDGRVLVDGVNIVSKHKKPSAQTPNGGVVEESASISISNVMLWDKTTKAPSRIRRERSDNGFVRIFKNSGEVIK